MWSLRILLASQQGALLAQGSFMATQKQEALVKFGKAHGDIQITNCRKEIRVFCCCCFAHLSVVARTSRIAAIILSTFYIAQRRYNLSQHLHQSAEVKKK